MSDIEKIKKSANIIGSSDKMQEMLFMVGQVANTDISVLVTGVVDALRELNITKLVVGTPYLDEINLMESKFLNEKGFDVLNIEGLNLETGLSFGKVTPQFWKKFALEIDKPEAEAIFLSCGGIRSLEVVQEVEEITGKPVITSNQAEMWSCLRRAGIKDKISGFGQIFTKEGISIKS